MHVDILCRANEINDEKLINKKIRKAAKGEEFKSYKLIRRWIDARGQIPKFGLRYELINSEDQDIHEKIVYQQVAEAPAIHIVGAGPAGYFAALECLTQGLKPIIYEQGKDVQERRRDLRAIQQEGLVNPTSNYCFGEGGAGTYSDGKLYTRSKKRGDVEFVLRTLVEHGAPKDIQIDAHPHIGSNKLPKIIANIRSTIESHGGEVHFNTQLTDILSSDGRIEAIVLNGEQKVPVERLILATGHSARSIYQLFVDKDWAIEAKPFAIGVRIEHPQQVIDQIQYNQEVRHENLPAAAYRLACEIENRGVFSFCMCPGGLIVPASTAPGEIVVNGMSLSRRDSPFANSGFVVAVKPEDLTDDVEANPLICLELQKELEKLMFDHGDGSQRAPAQRLVDFMEGIRSTDLPKTSYIPGLYSSRLEMLLPKFIVDRMKAGLKKFNRRMKGYIHEDAVVVGVESRTSSPVKIPRDHTSFQHPEVMGLYPCAEGAGYAGGIMSAALDGQRIVKAIKLQVSNRDEVN